VPVASGSRLGAYEVLALIGAGGMGEVYRARDTKLNRDVAIAAIKALPDLGETTIVTSCSSPQVHALVARSSGDEPMCPGW
jgi:serine/threonine protein kinase